MEQSFHVDHTHVLSQDVDGSDREALNPRDLNVALFQIHRSGAEWRFVHRDPQPVNKGAMQQGGKSASVDHQLGGRTVDGTVDVQVESVAHMNRRAAESADRKSTRLNSSHEWISYAVFCLKKKK